MSDVLLTVGGRRYGGWETASVTRGIESIAGKFALSVSERWAGQGDLWPINEEDECSVSVGGVTVLTGYVDEREPSYGPAAHAVTVEGRDKTGDLVDCSAYLGTWEYVGISVKTLAEKLCKPFGIRVSLQPGLVLPAPPPKTSIDPGETSFNVLEQACRFAGVLAVSDGAGGLVLTRAGSARASTDLVEGQNILSASCRFSASGRYRRYIVLGQHAGTDDSYGLDAASVKGTAEDPNVTRAERILVVRAEGGVTPAHAQKRAAWEASVRAARSAAVTVTVQGWTQGNGQLWPVNALVKVKSPRLQINGELLITQATYSVSANAGETTVLTLKRPDAFKPEPISKDGLWKEIARGV